MDESCDVWQPTAHRVFVFNLVIAQVMNLSKELKTTAEGHVNEWTFLFGRCDLCTDGARAMVGRFARPYEAS